MASLSARALVIAAGLDLMATASARAAEPPAAPPATSPPPAAPAAAAPAGAAPAAMPVAPPASPAPPPSPPPASAVAAEAATPPIASEAMPATREEKLPAIDVGAWVRAAGRLQGSNTKNLDSLEMDTAYAELHAGGKIHKNVSVTLNVNANGVPNGGSTAQGVGIEDAIIGFDVADPFHVWVGQLLVPVDRANFAGPFFMIPWNYPGFLSAGGTTVVTAPMEGPAGRNTGASIWGNDPDGKIKYAVGAFMPPTAATNPLFSGRISTALIGKETGYFGNETFFGDQDIVTIGVGGQYKKAGSVGPAPGTAAAPTGPAPTDDYAEFNADALAELKYGDSGGYFSIDAAYYHFAGKYQTVTDAFYATAAIATPKVGVGNIQPMVRIQQGSGANGLSVWSFDAYVAYLIMGPKLRITGGFEHTDLGSGNEANEVQLAAQAIFF